MLRKSDTKQSDMHMRKQMGSMLRPDPVEMSMSATCISEAYRTKHVRADASC